MESKKYNPQKISEIINDIRICTLLYCTKNGKVYSSSAEEYIKWLGEFSKYCIPEMKNDWMDTIRKIVYGVVVTKPKFSDDPAIQEIIRNNEYAIIDNLYNFMNAAEIMKVYDETHSWECVNYIVKKQGHSGWTFSGLSNTLIQYSLIGVDFIEKFDPNSINRDKDFKEYYNKTQEYITTRQVLNKNLIQAVSFQNRG